MHMIVNVGPISFGLLNYSHNIVLHFFKAINNFRALSNCKILCITMPFLLFLSLDIRVRKIGPTYNDYNAYHYDILEKFCPSFRSKSLDAMMGCFLSQFTQQFAYLLHLDIYRFHLLFRINSRQRKRLK